MTPPGVAPLGPWDSLARADPATSPVTNSNCSRDLLGTTLCTATGIQVGAESVRVCGRMLDWREYDR